MYAETEHGFARGVGVVQPDLGCSVSSKLTSKRASATEVGTRPLKSSVFSGDAWAMTAKRRSMCSSAVACLTISVSSGEQRLASEANRRKERRSANPPRNCRKWVEPLGRPQSGGNC